MRLRSFAALLAVLMLAWPAAAQEVRGSLEGYVRDSQGAVLPGVTITLTGGSGVKIDATTDSTGQYRFPSLQPGKYEVAANLAGFVPGKVSDVDVTLGAVKKVDFSLTVAGVSEKVEVTAESPLVDVRSAARSTTIRAEQVELLPHGRDFTTLVTQASGANNEPKSGGIMIDGASAAENRYIVDGQETTDLVHGQSGKSLIADFVDEVQVRSSGYSAEFGGSTGGVINVITKSGTNAFSGTGLYYYQGSSLQAHSNKSLRLDPTNASVAQYWTYPKDSYDRSEPGGSLGGPIMANKSWFWVGYLPTIQTTNRSVNAASSGVATANSVGHDQKFTAQNLSANQTAQISQKLRTRISYNNSWSKTTGLLPSIGGTDPAGVNYTKGTKNPNWTVSGQADYVASQKLFFGFRAGYFLQDTHDFNVPTISRIIFSNSTNIGIPGVPPDLQQPSNFANIPAGGNNAVVKDKQTRAFYQADATWFAHGGKHFGDHQLKGGVQFDNRGEDILSGETGHRVTLRWGGALQGQSGPYGYYSVRSNAVAPSKGFITQGNVKSNVVGLFIQDTWTLSNKLTINAGFRTENEKVPSFTNEPGVPANPIEFKFGDKPAPRVGASYDIKGDGRWKAYGSWGLFYDIFKLELPQGSFGGQKWIEYYYTLDTFDWRTLDAGANCPPTCSGKFIRSTNFRLPSVTPGVDIEPNLKPMRSQEASIGMEHQLNNFMAVGARYVHKQLDRAIDDTGYLTPQGDEGYVIANPSEGITQLAFVNPNVPLPKPQRKYDAVELSLEKRYSNNWYLRGAYTWSRLWGNYTGLSQSDENGRSDPNVGRQYDYPAMMFDQTGHGAYGPLPTDRPNQLKLSAIYTFKFGTTVSANQYVESGIPITREMGILPPSNYPMQYLGRGSDGRMDPYIQTDLFVQHPIKLGGRKTLDLQFNVLNLFNQRSVQNTFITYQQVNGVTFDQQAFYTSGVNIDQLAQQQGVVKDPRFLLPSGYQNQIQARFGVKFTF